METRTYLVQKIDGDYAWLQRTDTTGAEPILVARALLPEEIEEGTRLRRELFEYTII